MSTPERAGRSKWLLGTSLLAAGAAGLSYVANRSLRRWLDRPLLGLSGRLVLEGLRAPVEVIRDRWGVPHIYAADEADLFFAQGFIQAQDRLFQMDASRRLGAGRLSEIVGPPGLAVDRTARVFDWARAAEATIAGAGPESRAVMEAYAAGVNAFIEQGPLPPEFTLLAYRPEPWSPLASAQWSVVLAWGLSANWEMELLRALMLERLGPERAADLVPRYGPGYRTILPAADVGGRLAEVLIKAYQEAIRYLPLGDLPAGGAGGSNNWVVNGSWTWSGRPVLANDPHLAPIIPALWYECHLHGGPYHVAGFTSPGVPGILIGHNERVAWGITNAFPDVQDVYVERLHPDDPHRYEVEGDWREADVRREEIRVRGRRRPEVVEVVTTRHGPIISDLLPGESRALALRWASFEPNDHLRSLLGICRAEDWGSFREACRHYAFPSQNMVYADVDGNVGYLMPGRVPLRAGGQGLVPAPGWTDDHEWTGWIPAEEMPAGLNPISGAVVTANNRVHGSGYPYLLTGEWLAPYRAERIAELLVAYSPLSLEDHAAIQGDVVSLFARRFLAAALPALKAPGIVRADLIARLRTWDGEMVAGQVEPSLYFVLLAGFLRAAMEQAVGPLTDTLLGKGLLDGFPNNPFYQVATELSLRWLEEGAPDWVGDVRPLLPGAWSAALAHLRAEYGSDPAAWRWGNLHYVNLSHYFARVPGLGRLWKPRVLPLSGGAFTVNHGGIAPKLPAPPVASIASCRLLLDVGAWDQSLAALPGGQSGHPTSPHYQDGLEDWAAGRYHPMLFSREKVESEGVERLLLLPEKDWQSSKDCQS